MKFGVVVFPGSNCDRDMHDALKYDMNQEVIMLWHKDKDLSMFNTEDCIILPGGFSYGDYLRCGAIARFSPMMQSVIDFANSWRKSFWSLQWFPDPLRITSFARWIIAQRASAVCLQKCFSYK